MKQMFRTILNSIINAKPSICQDKTENVMRLDLGPTVLVMIFNLIACVNIRFKCKLRCIIAYLIL